MPFSIANIAQSFGRGLTHLLFPNSCWACLHIIDENQAGFCKTCRLTLTHNSDELCPKCAARVGPHTHLSDGCPSCRGQHFAFGRAYRMNVYDGVLRDVILRMKHWSGEGLAEMVGRLWATNLVHEWRDEGPDFVLPIPLHWRRRLSRGYNQSQILAEEIARHVHVPCPANWIRRVRNTPRQAGRNPVQRRKNVEGAFQASADLPIHGKSILLIDDVMTTGATLHEAARVLRPYRPKSIAVAVLARPA